MVARCRRRVPSLETKRNQTGSSRARPAARPRPRHHADAAPRRGGGHGAPALLGRAAPLLPRGPDGGQGAVRGRARQGGRGRRQVRRRRPPVDRRGGAADVMAEAHAKVGDAAPGLVAAARSSARAFVQQHFPVQPAPEPPEEIDDAVVRKILTTDRGPPSAEHVARWKAARRAAAERRASPSPSSSRCATRSSSASTTCRCRRRL